MRTHTATHSGDANTDTVPDRQRLYLHVNAVHTRQAGGTPNETTTSETAIDGVECTHTMIYIYIVCVCVYAFVYVHSARVLSGSMKTKLF